MARKRTLFVVSDIHGYCEALKTALAQAGFDKDNPDHILIGCGDYFDRGSENAEVLRFLEGLKHCILLRGNHEDLLLKLLRSGKLQPHHYINGTLQTVKNFFGKYAINPADDTVDFSGKTRVARRLFDFISDMADYYETDQYVFVHGWLPSGGETSEGRQKADREDWEEARWIKWTKAYTGERPLKDKLLVCGHVPAFFANTLDQTRPRDSTDIFYGNGLIAIDTGTHESKRVNVLVIRE